MGFGWRDAGPAVPAPRESTICVLPPETDRDLSVPEEFKRLYGNLNDRTCIVSISFTDATGHYWERNEHGILRQASALRQSGDANMATTTKGATR